MKPDPVSKPDGGRSLRAVAQPVAAPLTRAAIFLVATLNQGFDGRVTLRSFCGDLAALLRAVEFRDLEGGLSWGSGKQLTDTRKECYRSHSRHQFRLALMMLFFSDIVRRVWFGADVRPIDRATLAVEASFFFTFLLVEFYEWWQNAPNRRRRKRGREAAKKALPSLDALEVFDPNIETTVNLADSIAKMVLEDAVISRYQGQVIMHEVSGLLEYNDGHHEIVEENRRVIRAWAKKRALSKHA